MRILTRRRLDLDSLSPLQVRMRFALLLFLLPMLALAEPVVTNHEPDSEVRYPVVLLRGTIDEKATEITAKTERGKIEGRVRDGKFKVLAELAPGENKIELTSDSGKKTEWVLNFKKQTNPYYVRVIWMTDKSGATDYATSYENDPQNYEEKLDVAAKMLQTFTAERLFDTGYGRKTFRLELDDSGKTKIHTLAAPKGASHYYKIGDQQWYREINQWINKKYPDPFAKNIVIAAYTRKDPETGKMKAHTALGGGNQGLFGGASVFSWPDNLQDITTTFLSDEIVDPKQVHDDSAGRHTIWGLAATTLGATLHEMGHAFGLPHCTDGFGIMTRGFDRINRAFTFVDPPSRQNLTERVFRDDQVGYFAPVSGSYLQWSPWFQLDKPAIEDKARPQIQFDGTTGEIIVESKFPIRWLGLWKKDNVAKFKEFTGEQKKVTVSSEEWKALMGGDELSNISAVSENGYGGRIKINRE